MVNTEEPIVIVKMNIQGNFEAVLPQLDRIFLIATSTFCLSILAMLIAPTEIIPMLFALYMVLSLLGVAIVAIGLFGLYQMTPDTPKLLQLGGVVGALAAVVALATYWTTVLTPVSVPNIDSMVFPYFAFIALFVGIVLYGISIAYAGNRLWFAIPVILTGLGLFALFFMWPRFIISALPIGFLAAGSLAFWYLLSHTGLADSSPIAG